MRLRLLLAMTCAAVLPLSWQAAPVLTACQRCSWKPPAAVRSVFVNDVDGLERAVRAARGGDAILLSDGRYPLRRMLDIRSPDVTIRGLSGDPSRVVLHGGGMLRDAVGVAMSVSAPRVTIANVTIRDVGYHSVQVRGEAGASGFTLHNARLVDAGQQLLKVSVSGNGVHADDGTVACSEFSYSTHAPSDYTAGVDLLAAGDWVIRDNRFLRIRGPEARRWSAGPAILAWRGSSNTVVERNQVIDSFRGISLGLVAGESRSSRTGPGVDHIGGVVRNNVVVNLSAWADEGIEVNAGLDARVEHNTILVEGSLPWSISVRFPSSLTRVVNNLTNRQVMLRNGGRAVVEGNVSGAARSWFVDALHGDLRLSAEGAGKARIAGVREWRPADR